MDLNNATTPTTLNEIKEYTAKISKLKEAIPAAFPTSDRRNRVTVFGQEVNEAIDWLLQLNTSPEDEKANTSTVLLAQAAGMLPGLLSTLTEVWSRLKIEVELRRKDPKTGFLSYSVLKEEWPLLWSAHLSIKTPIGLIFTDLAGLKRVNDTYSHEVGDQAILACLTELNRHIRHTDLMTRRGGESDEALLVLSEVPPTSSSTNWFERKLIDLDTTVNSVLTSSTHHTRVDVGAVLFSYNENNEQITRQYRFNNTELMVSDSEIVSPFNTAQEALAHYEPLAESAMKRTKRSRYDLR